MSEIHLYPKNRNVAVEPFYARLKCVCGKNKIGKFFINLKLTQIEAIYNFELKKEIYMYMSVDSWLHIS